jgi:hypothetical protein
MYIAKDDGKMIQSVLELNKYDTNKNISLNNLLAIYSGFTEDMCQPINAFTFKSNITHTTCYHVDTDSYVAEYSSSLSNLMLRWLSLTSKLKIWDSQ